MDMSTKYPFLFVLTPILKWYTSVLPSHPLIARRTTLTKLKIHPCRQ